MKARIRTEIDQCLRECKHFLKANVDRTCINTCRWFLINLLILRKQRFWRPCWRKTKSQTKEANEIVLSRRVSGLHLNPHICAGGHCWVHFLNVDILRIISLILMCYFVVFQSENIYFFYWIFLLLFCCKLFPIWIWIKTMIHARNAWFSRRLRRINVGEIYDVT